MSRLRPDGIPAHRRVTAAIDGIDGTDGIETMTVYCDEQARGRAQAIGAVKERLAQRGLAAKSFTACLTSEGWDVHVWGAKAVEVAS